VLAGFVNIFHASTSFIHQINTFTENGGRCLSFFGAYQTGLSYCCPAHDAIQLCPKDCL